MAIAAKKQPRLMPTVRPRLSARVPKLMYAISNVNLSHSQPLL